MAQIERLEISRKWAVEGVKQAVENFEKAAWGASRNGARGSRVKEKEQKIEVEIATAEADNPELEADKLERSRKKLKSIEIRPDRRGSAGCVRGGQRCLRQSKGT